MTMSDETQGETPAEPVSPETTAEPVNPETPAEPINPELPPVRKPDQTTEDAPPAKTVGGAHDLSDHPAVSSGNVKNVGDTVLNRDPNAPAFRRPPLETPADQGEAEQAPAEQGEGEQSEGERTTTTSNPAKKASKGKSKGDGAGPES
jgi:hypothetical protein